MKISFDLNVILYFAAISIGMYTSIMLLFSVHNKTANRILSLLMLAITGWITDAFLRASGIYAQRPDLYFLPIYYSFAFGPLLYFYVRAITDKGFKFDRRQLLHFFPVFIQAAFYGYLALQNYQFKYEVWFYVHQPYTYRLEYDGTWLSLVIYLSLAIRYFLKYQSWLANNYSELSRKLLNWLKFSLITLILVCGAWLFEAFLRDFRNTYYQYDISTNLLCIVIYCIGVLGKQQAAISVEFKEEELPAQPESLPEVDSLFVEKIGTAMVTDRLYLNPELTLADLAAHIGLPAKTVSFTVNAAFGKPFNTYVNGFRVEEIKNRLQSADLEKFTLLGIAYESGFNSKTSFNRIFKEFTGSSPSNFIKK
ncbi:helix-turn-helix domain-containing protein [Mucilaginibacter terrae]|uniref:helix-turn-helix domain-containing protein n=1 Tax=Mucilaginibacter terrae TaxID=1955052 RepID=UPI003635816B